MITEIYAIGFKNQTFNQPITKHNIFLGPTGSGKSSKSGALVLALLGYIPGSGKKNSDILNTFGDGKKLTVGVVLNDKTRLERIYYKADKGVSQIWRVDQKKVSKEFYYSYLLQPGAPKVLDLGIFMSLSDQKKAEHLFDLFPPSGDVLRLNQNIEDANTSANNLERRVKVANSTIQRLSAARTAMQLPAGNLAEISGEILSTEEAINNAQTELQALKDADLKAETKASQAQLFESSPKNTAPTPSTGPGPGTSPGTLPRSVSGLSETINNAETSLNDSVTFCAAESIQAILDTLKQAGCGACAARLVAMRELKKWRAQR